MCDDIPGHQAFRLRFLETERLFFRIWRETDLGLASKLWGDPRVAQYIYSNPVLTENEVWKRFEEEMKTQAEYEIQYWPVFLKENDEFVGCCGLRPYNLPNRVHELGFHISADYWNRGFATEVASRVIAYSFCELKIRALFAGHNPKNQISRHLLLKLGFEHTHDEIYLPTGLKHPSYLLNRA